MEYKILNEGDKTSATGKIGEGDYVSSISCGNICTCACFCNCFGNYEIPRLEEVSPAGKLEKKI